MASGPYVMQPKFETRRTADITAAIDPITIRPGVTVKSSKSFSKHHEKLLQNPKLQKTLRSSYRKSARQTLSFVRAVRATLVAEEDYASRRIDEMEEYLGLLRAKKAMIQIRVSEADEQLGMVREALDGDGIGEVALSDDGSSSSAPSPPRTSDCIYPIMDSDEDSDEPQSSTYNSDGSIGADLDGRDQMNFEKPLKNE